jgi:hypothetical protein
VNVEIVGYIIIPLALFILGATAAGIRAIVKFAQYMAKSETYQAHIAKTNGEINDRLGKFIDEHSQEHRELGDRITRAETLIEVETLKTHRTRAKVFPDG